MTTIPRFSELTPSARSVVETLRTYGREHASPLEALEDGAAIAALFPNARRRDIDEAYAYFSGLEMARSFIRENVNELVNYNIEAVENADRMNRSLPDFYPQGKTRAEYITRPIFNPIEAEIRLIDRGQRVYLPFDGFNYTITGDLIDSAVESAREYAAEQYGESAAALFKAKTDGCAEAIARKWVEVYSCALARELDMPEIDGAFKFESIVYSRDYYASNDEIAARAPLSVLRSILRAVCSDDDRREKFAAAVDRRMTPASGWAPFFSRDWHKWGPIARWNEGQISLLLETICPYEEVRDFFLEDLSSACDDWLLVNWEEMEAAAKSAA